MTATDWRDPARRALGAHFGGAAPALLLLSAAKRGVSFRLPAVPAHTRWRPLLSSACEQPNRVRRGRIQLAPLSCVWLVCDGSRGD